MTTQHQPDVPAMSPQHNTSQSAVDDELTRILEERAVALAERPQDEDEDGDRLELVVVAVGGERYGVPIACVREIKPLEDVTPLPATPPYWRGLSNLRGNLHPVLDLRRYLGITHVEDPQAPQLVVVGAAALTVGLQVDRVDEVRMVRTGDIGPPIVEGSIDRVDVHAGLTDDLVSVLDVEALLGDPSLQVQDGAI